MKPHFCTLAGALALAALLPGTASAQNLAQDVFSGQYAPTTVPLTVGTGQPAKVIKSNQEALAARVYDLVPPNALVHWDFSNEMLILAVDSRPSAPGRVSISVERKPLFSISWVPLNYLEVTVTRHVPAPGTFGLPATIRPYALVKLPTSDELVLTHVVTQTMTPPSQQAFTEISRRLVSQPAINWTGPGGAPHPHRDTQEIEVKANGQVTITRWASLGLTGIPPITGTATQAELRALNQAVRQARFNQIPIDLGSGFPQFTFRVLGLPAGDRKIQGVRGQEGQFKTRLDAVHAALDAIKNRLSPGTPPTPAVGFDQVTRRLSTSPAINWTGPGGFPHPPHRSVVSTTIEADGSVTVSHWSTPGLTGIPPKTGTATPAELRRLSRAIRRARLTQIPTHLPGAGNQRFMLNVTGLPQGDRRLRGVRGAEGQYASRLNRVHAAIDAIQQRIDQGAPALSYDLVSRTTRFPLQRSTEALLIDEDGNATLRITRRPPMPPQTITGKLTSAEETALSNAVTGARLASVPGTLPMPVHIVAGNTFELKVSANAPANTGDVKGEIGYYTSYANQLQPVMSVLDGIANRLKQNAPLVSPNPGHHGGHGHGLTGGINSHHP